MAETTISGAVHPILENDYASEWMGIEVLSLGDGQATIRMTLRQEMLNGFGMAHGGMIFAFADTAFALACNPATPAAGTPTLDEGAPTPAAGTPTPDEGPETPGAGAADTNGAAGAAADSITVASGVDINFLKPAFQGQVITAVANRRSSTGRSGLYDIQIFAADPGSELNAGKPGELIAEFRGRSRTIPKTRNKS
ncbi:hotdog fold thioesterase [Arthrobacter sp. NPDC093139]|uniref:hotdog fold thioesterase n=1 Tax=Arthrobacter sp. NPDC093139 TaxID=3363945 RepID=UPI003803FC04